MNTNDRFELIAALYWLKTGHLAPGKDRPVGWGGDPEEDRRHFIYWVANDGLSDAAVEALRTMADGIHTALQALDKEWDVQNDGPCGVSPHITAVGGLLEAALDSIGERP